jgi:hypothetical protein
MRARILFCVIPELERCIKFVFGVYDVKIDVIYNDLDDILGERKHGEVEQ